MTSVVTATAIAEEQDFSGIGIIKSAISAPPTFNASTGKFRGVMACANREIADVVRHIIESMGNGDALRQRTKVMVIDLDLRLAVEFARTVKIAD